jgi:hypothetical protein
MLRSLLLIAIAISSFSFTSVAESQIFRRFRARVVSKSQPACYNTQQRSQHCTIPPTGPEQVNAFETLPQVLPQPSGTPSLGSETITNLGLPSITVGQVAPSPWAPGHVTENITVLTQFDHQSLGDYGRHRCDCVYRWHR